MSYQTDSIGEGCLILAIAIFLFLMEITPAIVAWIEKHT